MSGVGRSKISHILVGLRSLGTLPVGMIHFRALTACRSAAGELEGDDRVWADPGADSLQGYLILT